MLLLACMIGAVDVWQPATVDGGPGMVSADNAWTTELVGEAALANDEGMAALVLDGSTHVLVGDDQGFRRLPGGAFTVEAWVQLDAPMEWGGIVSCLQDNGSQEQGWVLGFRRDAFCFGLATTDHGDADGTMTYLVAPDPFVKHTWHHVAGTWDGSVQRLWVDGRLVAEDATQSGDVRWPVAAPLALGAYLDANERYPMRGLLGDVKVHEGVLDAPALAAAATRTTTDDPARELINLGLADEALLQLQAGVIPGEDRRRVLRMPWNTGPVPTFEVDLLVRVPRAGGDGTLLAAAEDGAGWSIELRQGVPVAVIERERGQQVVKAATPLPRDAWTLVRLQVQETRAVLEVDDAVATNRTLHGPARPASHRHLVVGGARADLAESTLRLDVRGVRLAAGRRTTEARAAHARAAAALVPPPPRVLAGPIVRTLGAGRWAVEWLTDEDDEQSGAFLAWAVGDEPFTRTRAQVDGNWRRVVLHPPTAGTMDDRQLQVRVEARTPWGSWRQGDVHSADLSIDLTAAGHGYVLYLEPSDIAVPVERAAADSMQITVATADPARVQAIRRAARERGLPANRLAVHQLHDDVLPWAPWLFNEVHVGECAIDPARIALVVRPEGGVLTGLADSPGASFDRTPAGCWMRGIVPGAKWWGRQYAGPGHTSCSNDDLVQGELHVLWWGRPGPRPMLDRGARSSSPLASHGRLFVQGNHAIFALDAYNGAPLWTLSMPYLRRTNVPRDSSNMAVGPEGDLHLAVQDDLWIIDGASGAVERVLSTDSTNRAAERDWGVVDPLDEGGQLLTHVPREAMYTGAEGEWYDAGGTESWRVGGDRLERRSADGDLVWAFDPSGWVLHSTLARDDAQVLFVEVPDVPLQTPGLLPQAALQEQDLVSLDLTTGEELWRAPLEVGHFDRMTYVLLSGDVAIVAGSSNKFHTLAFDARTGEPMWAKDHAWGRDHHGGPLQHPVIIGDIAYVETCAYDLHTGELLRMDIPQGRGCGTKTASNHLLAFRHHFHSYWDPDSNEWTEWTGTRGGCWLGLLPAGGMLLGPETSSGCSCTHAIQASMAWIPVHLDPSLERAE